MTMAPRLQPGEHRLVTVCRALVSSSPGALELFRESPEGSVEIPEALSPAAMDLFRQSLARGCARYVLIRGGWRESSSLDGSGQVIRGRLWERVRPLPPLTFTAPSFALCRWLAGDEPLRRRGIDADSLASGDELLFLIAFDQCSGSRLADELAATQGARRSTLSWLNFPQVLATHGRYETGSRDLAWLTDGIGAVLLESLSDDMTRRLVEIERGKANIDDPERLTDLGNVQRSMFTTLLDVLDGAGRRDLASPLVDAAARLLLEFESPRDLARLCRGSIDRRTSLRERQRACRAAGAFLDAVATVGRWNEEHRVVRVFDDEYLASQMLLSRWEHLGLRGFRRIVLALRELESIDSPLNP